MPGKKSEIYVIYSVKRNKRFHLPVQENAQLPSYYNTLTSIT